MSTIIAAPKVSKITSAAITLTARCFSLFYFYHNIYHRAVVHAGLYLKNLKEAIASYINVFQPREFHHLKDKTLNLWIKTGEWPALQINNGDKARDLAIRQCTNLPDVDLFVKDADGLAANYRNWEGELKNYSFGTMTLIR